MTRAALFLGLGIGASAMALLAPATGTALGELRRARGERLAAAAVREPASARVALLASTLRLSARDESGARRAFAAQVRELAARGGVLVEQLRPLPGGAGLVRMQLRLSGRDKAVIALVDQLERGTPLIRFDRWRAVALGEDGVRIEGEAVGTWR